MIIANQAGIYMVINTITEKYYIGSAVNFLKRWGLHKNKLRLNKHENSKLQYAWNKYGEESFYFHILEIVEDRTKLIEREQYWIDNSECINEGYNINPTAGSNLGRKWSEETKKKMSLGNKARIKSKEWQEKIKQSIVNSEKVFRNRRNKEKWPHTKRCNCNDCTVLKSKYYKEYYSFVKSKNLTQMGIG